ncbi:MAG TPA: hypothetical protein VFO76_12705, partial [Candidatus Kapabacteria bacterium]|nr:hypothetical protein [Candidatus Kapabacteria bacterium]
MKSIIRLSLGIVIVTLFFAKYSFAQYYDYPAYATTNTEYKFHQFKVVDDSRFYDEPVINLSMDCLAANGYGQWTVSSNTGQYANIDNTWLINPNLAYNHGPGWFLLGNLIGKPSKSYSLGNTSAHPGCQPPGIVAGGNFAGVYSTLTPKPKATANLHGSVRFVWVDNTTSRNEFHVEGLNDIEGTDASINPTPEIDIAVDKLPAPWINRQVVKENIFQYANAKTQTSGSQVHTVITETGDWRDEFDIACDAKYLYIVWASTINLPGTGNTKGIWATAIDLKTGAKVSGYPILVSTQTIGVAINDQFPTVACDVRNNPSSPNFYVSYIDLNVNKAVVKEFLGTTMVPGHQETLLQFILPIGTPVPPAAICTTATHSRVVVSRGVGVSPIVSVYVLTTPTLLNTSLCHDLVLYNNIQWVNDIAKYVDG